jgi:hypothetical protein
MGLLQGGDLLALTITNIALGVAVCGLCLYVVVAGVWECSSKRHGKTAGLLSRDLRLIETSDTATGPESRAQARS